MEMLRWYWKTPVMLQVFLCTQILLPELWETDAFRSSLWRACWLRCFAALTSGGPLSFWRRTWFSVFKSQGNWVFKPNSLDEFDWICVCISSHSSCAYYPNCVTTHKCFLFEPAMLYFLLQAFPDVWLAAADALEHVSRQLNSLWDIEGVWRSYIYILSPGTWHDIIMYIY